jgi:hypothetical protein
MFVALGFELFLLIIKEGYLQYAKEYKWKYVKEDASCWRIAP